MEVTPKKRRHHKPKAIPAEIPPTGFVRGWVVDAFYPVSDDERRRLEKAGKFPKRIKIGPRAIAYDCEQLHAHFKQLREAS